MCGGGCRSPEIDQAGWSGPEGRANRVNLGGGDKEPGEYTKATHNRVKAEGKGMMEEGNCARGTPQIAGRDRRCTNFRRNRGNRCRATTVESKRPEERTVGNDNVNLELQAKTRAKTEFQRHKEGEDGGEVGGHVIEPGDRAGGAGGPGDLTLNQQKRLPEEPDEGPDIRGKFSRTTCSEETGREPGILNERFRATARPEQPNLEDGMSSSFRKGSLDPNPTKELGKQRFRREPETGGGL
ncbi:hypothetical protein R3P38DRAFT_2765563 [Favolaschia claudopus]|uniref:Uncharacterized protein n=1 Tax=Favolaschia claudopus TaxID=2862362 RepID=A0AAW0D322_9AGAR